MKYLLSSTSPVNSTAVTPHQPRHAGFLHAPPIGRGAVENANDWAQMQAIGMSGAKGLGICMLSFDSPVILKNAEVAASSISQDSLRARDSV